MSNPTEALPGPCQEDLELLRNTIRELAGGHPGGQPVPADRFGAVFLTGATGFVGRFVLSELLRQNDHMLVHCLVRAGNAKQALARVQAALESAGLWDDYLADRIRAWPGDLREPRFGLPELDFPVAIMRLPQLGVAAATSHPRSSDIKIWIAMAALDAGVIPSGFRLPWTEPVDTVSEILTAISLNPRRRHTIYHLCHPAPQTWGLELADFGFGLREVSYAEFKRACQARAPRGPLYRHWPLVDRFADYWFPAEPQVRPADLE